MLRENLLSSLMAMIGILRFFILSASLMIGKNSVSTNIILVFEWPIM